MTTTRKAKKVEQPLSEADYRDALAQYANASARLNVINAEMEEQFTKIREANQQEVNSLNQQITGTFDIVSRYCTENKDKLFGKNKSFESAFGTVGFRTDPPSLKTLTKVKWDDVLANLKRMKLSKFVRTKEEVKKDELLAARTTDVAKKFPEIGVRVAQTEQFFITLKKEEAETAAV